MRAVKVGRKEVLPSQKCSRSWRMKSQNHSPRIQRPHWQNQTAPCSFTSGKYRQTPPNTFGCCFWPTQDAPAPKAALHPWGSCECTDGGASPSLWQSQQMALVGAEQTGWWIFHTERFFTRLQRAVAGWKMDSHLPVVSPGRTHWVFGTQGCFLTRVLSDSAGGVAPMEIIIPLLCTTPRTAAQSPALVCFRHSQWGWLCSDMLGCIRSKLSSLSCS